MVNIPIEAVEKTDFSCWLHCLHVLVGVSLAVKNISILVSNNEVEATVPCNRQLDSHPLVVRDKESFGCRFVIVFAGKEVNFKHIDCLKVDHEDFFEHEDIAEAGSRGGVRGKAGCVGHFESRTEGIRVVFIFQCLVKQDPIEGFCTIELQILLLVVACWTNR